MSKEPGTELPGMRAAAVTRPASSVSAPTVFSKLAPARPSKVYDTYWRFAAERQAIFFRRIEQPRGLWTEDPVLAKHKFTNAYRASDRVSQFLIRRVIHQGDQDVREVFFRTVLFKLFNRIATWTELEKRFGTPTWKEFNFRRYDDVLTAAMERDEKIYSAAYIIPMAAGFDGERKHQTHLRLLEKMMKEQLPERLAEVRSLRSAFERLRTYPMMGDFLAFQFTIDLNYGSVLNFPESDFVVPGPGARDGIRKCFTSTGGLSEADIIRVVAERQQVEFERLGLAFRDLWGRPLQLIDCQNLFCEVDKYARVVHPDVKGLSGRTRIKQAFKPLSEPIAYWYPPKWGLNERVSATCLRPPELLPASHPSAAEGGGVALAVVRAAHDPGETKEGVTVTMGHAVNAGDAMCMDEYQAFVKKTRVRQPEDGEGVSFALLGLYGETGSLLSEVKKKRREEEAYPAYAETVIEEFGDVLWYLADLANRVGASLSEVAQMAHRNTATAVADADFSFGDLQGNKDSFAGPKLSPDYEWKLARLGAAAGDLLRAVDERRGHAGDAAVRDLLAHYLRALVEAADAAEISLEHAAARNREKVVDRWPIDRSNRAPLFDEGYDDDERLLRNFDMHFIERTVRGKKYVVQRCQGIKVGDRLTDNMVEDDGYRFHDVFHLSYAAILGWSPVTRSLFRCKRKSNPTVDEVEDGARAIIIEEGVSTWIFNHAKGRKFFAGLETLDYGLLKAIRKLVAGFEVERCPLWQWERAIIEGFRAFRQLRDNGGGVVSVNLDARELHYRIKP